MQYDRRRIARQNGSAAILTIFVMALLGSLGAAFLVLSSTEIKTAANFRDGVAAQYLAEAGARRTMLKLSQDSSWMPSPSPLVENLGAIPMAGRYEVSVTNTGGNKKTVVSTGIVNKARRQIVLVLSVGSAPSTAIAVVSWNNY